MRPGRRHGDGAAVDAASGSDLANHRSTGPVAARLIDQVWGMVHSVAIEKPNRPHSRNEAAPDA